ncbi:cytochrome c oxidase subunit 6C [Musca domestica]|uniref:Cytochrome c oxidase subunit 6C n=1 Tax=Musca domestica TaxID=7370 RepID=A0A1I8MN19_MUSDO|nr:cytochrome c oxidase subunit 6C [Musca domestica]
MGIPKFPMHNVHFYKSMKNVAIAVVLALSASTAFNVLHNMPRKHKYANFYTNYDPMVSFYRMMEGGYLDSCPPLKAAAPTPKK